MERDGRFFLRWRWKVEGRRNSSNMGVHVGPTVPLTTLVKTRHYTVWNLGYIGFLSWETLYRVLRFRARNSKLDIKDKRPKVNLSLTDYHFLQAGSALKKKSPTHFPPSPSSQPPSRRPTTRQLPPGQAHPGPRPASRLANAREAGAKP